MHWKLAFGLSCLSIAAAISSAAQASGSPTSAVMPQAVIRSASVGAVSAAELKQWKKKYDLARFGARGVGAGLNFYSAEDEQTLGEDAEEAIAESATLISDELVVSYVARVGNTVAEHSEAKQRFVFHVIDSPEVNAMALPNGAVYVNSGLLLAIENEAELAGVLAHEIAHVAARHGTRSQSRRGLLAFATMSLSMVGGAVPAALAPVAQVSANAVTMKYSRDSEREADILGLEYAYLAGYDPNAFVSFLQRMNAEHARAPKKWERLFATHPVMDDRIERARLAIENLLAPRASDILDTSEREEIQRRLHSAAPGSEGSTRDRPVLGHAVVNASDTNVVR